MTVSTQYILFFQKIFYAFFPFGIVLLVFLQIILFYFIKDKELQSLCIKLYPSLFLRNNYIFMLCYFKAILKILNLIMH